VLPKGIATVFLTGASTRLGVGLARFGGDGFCFIMKSDKKNIMNREILDFFGS
jgi:hypothetical protein